MKKYFKIFALILCFVSFAAMALGSTSSDGDKKDVVDSSKEETVKNSIDEQLLFDKDGIKVTALEYVEDSIWGDGIKLLMENNTDKTVMVSCNALIVNNYMISDLFASEVAPGKKSNDTLYLSSSELEASGIESVGQVEIYFHVYDSETYDTIFDVDCVTIKTTEFANMDTTPTDSGTELYNEGNIKIVGKAVDENSFWGTAILLYCENSSGRNICISVEEMSINGFMMSPLFISTVYDGKMAIDDITVFSSELEENGITSIEEVELKFHIYDADTYDTIIDTDAISFTVE